MNDVLPSVAAPYHRVLCTQPSFLIGIEPDAAPGIYRRRGPTSGVYQVESALPRLVEEFVALGATEIVVLPDQFLGPDLNTVPTALRRRVKDLTGNREPETAMGSFLKPLEAEGIEYTIYLNRRRHNVSAPAHAGDRVLSALRTLVPALHIFLVGLEQRAQVDIDLPRFRWALATLRVFCRCPTARAHLAALEGVLACYRPVEAPAVGFRSGARPDQVALFRDLIEDAVYQDLSRSAHLLGVPSRVSRATTLMRRRIRQLSAKPLFRPLLNLASRGIEAATDVPAPDSAFADVLAGDGYLPPIVPLTLGYTRALRSRRRLEGAAGEAKSGDAAGARRHLVYWPKVNHHLYVWRRDGTRRGKPPPTLAI
jgi:hypothetical protein